MNGLKQSFLKFFVQQKVYLQRAQGYLTILQFVMLVYLTIDSLGRNTTNIIMILLVMIILALVQLAGYIDYHSGAFEEEQQLQQKKNPNWKRVSEKLDTIIKQTK